MGKGGKREGLIVAIERGRRAQLWELSVELNDLIR